MDHHHNYMLDLLFKTHVIQLVNHQRKTYTEVSRMCRITPFQVDYIMFLLPDVLVQYLNLQYNKSAVAALLGVTEEQVQTIYLNWRATMDGPQPG